MLNDREDKYEGHEESEYHFSDEEVNYEVETESPKQATASAGSKESVLNRLRNSRRMVISGIVFLVLIFVVYKMVTPTVTTPPATDIAPAIAQQKPPMSSMPAQQNPPMQAETANASNNVISVPGAVPAQAPMTQPAMMSPPQSLPPQQVTAQMAPPTNAAMPAVSASQPPAVQQAIQPSAMPQQPSMSQQALAPQQMAVQQPGVVQQQSPQQASALPVVPAQSIPNQSPMAAPASVDSRIATLAIENEKLINQMQADYAQRLNDFSNQNKVLQAQLQVMNTRIASMENQMGQLMQALTRQVQGQASGAPPSMRQQQPQGPEPKIAYNVQAIIPGRAWLRSDNGETVTVAEGDVIKDIGRVTKIDPYDGTVEINTGNRVVSLSYGSGG